MKKFFLFILLSTSILSYSSTNKLLPKPQIISFYNDTVKKHPPVIIFIDSIPNTESRSDETYFLKISKEENIIKAFSPTGVFRAQQTMEQLAIICNNDTLYPTCEITDWPAFRVRGFMHDVGRTYISMDELKKEIDLLSKFKINVFHWHLTENQAWRLESKLYPELNSPENMTRMPGKFYTLEEAKELVEFCKERYT